MIKKFATIGICLFTFQFSGNSQVNKHALGLRYGSIRTSEISYQYGLGGGHRLDIGLRLSGHFKTPNYNYLLGRASFYYQHVWNIKGGLNWFLGAGAQYTMASIDNSLTGENDFYSYLGLGPQIGLEYDFNQHNIPLILGIDYRPTFGTQLNAPGKIDFRNNFGLSLRYTFGN